MTRLLIVVFLIAVVVIASRRRSKAARPGRRKSRVSGAAPRPIGAPERLVCGACGTEFDPEKSGWICPKCGK
jgi:rubrerythrin